MRILILTFLVFLSTNLLAQKNSVGFLVGNSAANQFTKLKPTNQFTNSIAFGLTYDFKFTDNLVLNADLFASKTAQNFNYDYSSYPESIFIYDDFYYINSSSFSLFIPIKIGYRFTASDYYFTPKIGLYSNFSLGKNYGYGNILKFGKTAELEIGKTIKNFNLFAAASVLAGSEISNSNYINYEIVDTKEMFFNFLAGIKFNLKN